MIERSDTIFYWTETSLHVGSGSSVGPVDLPIQRNRQTSHPIAQYGGIKGVLRNHCEVQWGSSARDKVDAIFGPEAAHADFGSAVQTSEARILLFPMRSLRGVFAWITCPLALAFFKRDLTRTGINANFPGWGHGQPAEGEVWVSPNSPVALPPTTAFAAEAVLEQYRFAATVKPEVSSLSLWLRQHALPSSSGYEYWQDCMHEQGASHLMILRDEDFSELVEHATDVVQRISISADTGTTANMGLWTEENLPCDSLLYSILHLQKPRGGSRENGTPDCMKENGQPDVAPVQRALHTVLSDNTLLQMGGSETGARGLTRVRLLKAT